MKIESLQNGIRYRCKKFRMTFVLEYMMNGFEDNDWANQSKNVLHLDRDELIEIDKEKLKFQ